MRKLRPLQAKRPKGAVQVNRTAFQSTRDVDVGSVYNWEQRKELGSGSFGAVFMVKHRFSAAIGHKMPQKALVSCECRGVPLVFGWDFEGISKEYVKDHHRLQKKS